MADAYLRMRFWRRRSLQAESDRRRRLRDLSDPLDIPESVFIANYRISKEVFIYLCEKIAPFMQLPRRNTGVALELKVLTTLSFLATGSYQKSVGSDWHTCHSQKSVSRHITTVVDALNKIMPTIITFPGTRLQRDGIKQNFNDKFGFPGVIGCIDGTHIAILKPSVHEEVFFNRKGYHSINTAVICDSNLNILCICARFGGSAHDAHIWRSMAIRPYIEGLSNDGESLWLLGDSAYALRPTMMTPILNAAEGTPEAHYTELHCRVRNRVERCFGVLKTRWRCLLRHRVLHYAPEKASKIINACAVLHNICIAARIPEPNIDFQDHNSEDNTPPNVRNVDNLEQGQTIRNQLVARIYNTIH